uniref:Integrase core domain containing protein n=1 Tax=Solanum tuberosum TaxID=4113 RepID=M1DXI3_SOLTU
MVVGLEVDFVFLLIDEIHERAFKATTTLSFPCLIFQLCGDVGVPVWHCDRLVQATKTLDISIIRDEANVIALRREPEVEVSPLGDDLVEDVEQAPSSSRATPSSGAIAIPLSRVQKLEAQMASLLQLMRPWMQRAIEEFEAKVEKWMESMMEQKIQAIHKRLDAFEE